MIDLALDAERDAWIAEIKGQVRPRMKDRDVAIALERVAALQRLSRQLELVAERLAALSEIVRTVGGEVLAELGDER